MSTSLFTKGLGKIADNNNIMQKKLTINNEEFKIMEIKIYLDGVFFGWGVWEQIPSYRANGWVVEVTFGSQVD